MSLSTAGTRQGTLRLLPFLPLSTAYIMLRPFFRLRPGYKLSDGEIALAAENWEVDLESTNFPGSEMAKAQCLSEESHPHLRLDKSLVTIPQVDPGDQVYCGLSLIPYKKNIIHVVLDTGHCDLVHAVESEHSGTSDSSVFYIPAVPLTVKKYVPQCVSSGCLLRQVTVLLTYATNLSTLKMGSLRRTCTNALRTTYLLTFVQRFPWRRR